MSLYDRAKFILTPSGVMEGKIFSPKPINGSGDLIWSRDSKAYHVNGNNTVALVSNDKPRIDFYNGSAKILNEAESTNLVPSSNERFFNSNPSQGIVLTFNYADSPFGANRATYVKQGNSSGAGIRMLHGSEPEVIVYIQENTTYTFSFWAKNLVGTGSGSLRLHSNIGEVGRKTITMTSEWRQHYLTFTSQAGATQMTWESTLLPINNISGEFLIDAMQLELGTTATSAIINNGTINTRASDIPETINPVTKGFLLSDQGTIVVDNTTYRYTPDGNKETFVDGVSTGTVIEAIPTSWTLPKGETERVLMFDYPLTNAEITAIT